MWRRAWLAMVVAALWMAPAGCTSGTLGGNGGSAPPPGGPPAAADAAGPMPELVSMSRPPIADLPVPIGFDLSETRSRNLAAAGARFVDHVYTGRSDKFAVWRFYKRLMAINRWVLVTDKFIQGEIQMDFEKEAERCQVTILNGGFLQPTVVKIVVMPSGRVTTPQGAIRTNNIR
jgi:hypothetical protein